MQLSTIKILGTVVSTLGLSDYEYIPLNTKLAAMSASDYMTDTDLNRLINQRDLDDVVAKMEIIGIATRKHARDFLKNPSGKRLVNHLIRNSTYMNSKSEDEDIVRLIAEAFGND